MLYALTNRKKLPVLLLRTHHRRLIIMISGGYIKLMKTVLIIGLGLGRFGSTMAMAP